jgi:hypothetical protein
VLRDITWFLFRAFNKENAVITYIILTDIIICLFSRNATNTQISGRAEEKESSE